MRWHHWTTTNHRQPYLQTAHRHIRYARHAALDHTAPAALATALTAMVAATVLAADLSMSALDVSCLVIYM